MKFVVHTLEKDNDIKYQLSFGEDNLQFYEFSRTGLMATISDVPNTTRLFGLKSEDPRAVSWMSFSGDTKDGIYKIFDSGDIKVVEETPKHYKLSFNGEKITGDWYLRRIPNVFDKALFGENTFGWIFWKPGKNPKVEVKTSTKNASNLDGRFNLDLQLDPEEQTFEGIAAAEGTWVDMFGVPYMYTSDFIQKIVSEQQSKLASGQSIPLNTEHPSDELAIDGEVTEVQLVREPINHIRVKGKYRGATTLSEGDIGLSYEFRFKSSWNEEFQAWVPFDNITDKLSVVKRPACKICWITKVI